MKLPHRRQFLHLAAAAAALPAPPDADTKTPPGWAPRAESRGNPRVPLRSEGGTSHVRHGTARAHHAARRRGGSMHSPARG
jgi:hypothetical protein